MKKISMFLRAALMAILFLLVNWNTFGQTKYADLRDSEQKTSVEEFKNLEQKSLTFLRREIENQNLNYSSYDFRVLSVQIDDLEMSHTRVLQTYKGIPVWGSEAIIHLNKDESLFSITNDLLSGSSKEVQVVINENEAVNTALSKIVCEDCKVEVIEKPDMWLFPIKRDLEPTYRIQIEVTLDSLTTQMPVFFISARSGQIVFSYDNLQKQSATGSGSSLYSGTVNFTTFRFGASYFLENQNLRIGTFNNLLTAPFLDSDNIWNTATQRAAVDAHWGTEKTLSYFSSVHGRNGIDGNGGPGGTLSSNGLVSIFPIVVHYNQASSPNVSFYNGRYTYYGDGDGMRYSPLTSLDIVGHETTHAITKYSAGLVYSGESGALNEAMSDVFGAMVERYVKGESSNTWRIGEQPYTPTTAGDAPRFLDNPHQAPNAGWTPDDYPDHYSERRFVNTYGAEVHINAGIPGKAFYLLAKGGSHHLGGIMPGIGADQAARIWYRALTFYMTSTTNFVGARTAMINAANELYGTDSFQSKATAYSWCMVGVGNCTCATSKLASGQYLVKGQSLKSCNGFVTLTFQNDGNVVLYRYDGVPLWNTGTGGRTDANQFLMRGDGVLVLYAGSAALWYTRTFNYPGAYAILQDDMNFVIYNTAGNALWSTGTTYR